MPSYNFFATDTDVFDCVWRRTLPPFLPDKNLSRTGFSFHLKQQYTCGVIFTIDKSPCTSLWNPLVVLPMAFAQELKSWRGKLLQKEAADILKVPLDTYRAWEHGQHEPKEVVTKSEIVRRMAEYKNVPHST
jgi:hypothetical protein